MEHSFSEREPKTRFATFKLFHEVIAITNVLNVMHKQNIDFMKRFHFNKEH